MASWQIRRSTNKGIADLKIKRSTKSGIAGITDYHKIKRSTQQRDN